VDGNAIKHQLVAYITEPGNMKDIKSELVYNVQELFHEKGITALFSD
jgi:small-conductance mechanosensitive channel